MPRLFLVKKKKITITGAQQENYKKKKKKKKKRKSLNSFKDIIVIKSYWSDAGKFPRN